MSINKTFKRLAVAAMAAFGITLSHGAAANVYAQEIVTATVPVTVSVAATVSITPPDDLPGAVGVSAEVPAGTTPTILTITLAGGNTAVSHRAQGRGAAPVVINHSRGNVSLRLSPQQYGKAEISLFAVNGRRVLKGKADAAKTGLKISRNNVAAGVYLLSVKGVQGNFHSNKIVHSGGRLNINVAFGDVSGIAPRLAKGSAEAAYGEWTIRARAIGYRNTSETFAPVAGANPPLTITLEPGDGDDSFEAEIMPDGKKWTTRNLNVLTASSWCYRDSTEYCDKYGRLYTWNAAQEACQSLGNGWALPTDDDWTALTEAAGGATAGTNLKSATGWTAHATVPAGIDRYGFSALPGGRRVNGFRDGNVGYWWTATEVDGVNAHAYAHSWYMNHDNETVRRQSHDRRNADALSVRCVLTPVDASGLTITFDANGGTVSPATGTTDAGGKLASLPNPTRSGFTFDGWINATTGRQVTANTEFPRSTIVYARWSSGDDVDPFEAVIMPDGKKWTKRNLNVLTASSWCYNNSPDSCAKYGRLYTWNAAHEACATVGNGWRLPTNAEWTALTDTALVYSAGTKLKSATGWTAHATVPAGIDQYGFSALPGGRRVNGFRDGNVGYWWTATEVEGNAHAYAHSWYMSHDNEAVRWQNHDRRNADALSVRCIWTPFAETAHTITFDANGGTVSQSTGTTGTDGKLASLPAPSPRAGFTFDGWFSAATGARVTTSTEFSKNTIVYARWISNGGVDDPFETVVTPDGKKWMKRNLNVIVTGSSWCYRDSTDYCDKYGRLYYWDAAREACSGIGDGWRLPTNDEWTALTDTALVYSAGTKLKSATGWESHSTNPPGIDQYGFSALPGGRRVNGFRDGGTGYWWTATEVEGVNAHAYAYSWYMTHDNETVRWQNHDRRNADALSVRCVSTGAVASKSVTITFDANGGSAVSPSTQTIIDISPKFKSLPIPTRAGLTFDGWFTAATGGTQVTISTVFTQDATIYARWGTGTVTDPRDNQSYKSVAMPDGRVWLAENINHATGDLGCWGWDSRCLGGFGSWCYNGEAANCGTYGRIYSWPNAVEACDGLGERWRLPSDEDWTGLESAIGGAATAGTKLRSKTGWTAHATVPVGTDDYGFAALPGGWRWNGTINYDPDYRSVGVSGGWWTSTQTVPHDGGAVGRAMARSIVNDNAGVDRIERSYTMAESRSFSARCVRD